MNDQVKALPRELYSAEQVRELDRRAMEGLAVSGYELMQRAANAAYTAALSLLNHKPGRRLLVVCGAGNNGGDGYVLARIARLAGHQVRLVPLVPEERLTGEAQTAAQHWREVYGPTTGIEDVDFADVDLIIDAILGTGLQREVAGDYLRVIEQINSAGCSVLSLDIPSGLSADTGMPLGVAVKADLTISFVGLKQGLFTGLAADYCGRIEYADLSAPEAAFAAVNSRVHLLQPSIVSRVLPKRARCAHKGRFGHILVVGGDQGMAGAVCMAGRAALRCGAGLVTLATHPAHAALAGISQPELMSHGVEKPGRLAPLLEKATLVAIGPGLGTSKWAQGLFARVMDSNLPLVVDADALNLLAENPGTRGNWVLTPHPGEAARLLNCTTADVQADRYAAVTELARRYRAVTVLKGAGSLIAAPDHELTYVCNRGHPGMASAGMGDVLTGVIAGVMAQCNNIVDAATTGVWLHAAAAEQAAVTGERGITATDLLVPLHAQVNSNG